MPTARSVLATLAGGALLYAATGLHPLWWLVPLAPVPVLWLAPRVSAPAAALAAFAAWVGGTTNMIVYYRTGFEVPWLAIAVVSLAPSFVFAAIVVGWRALVRRGWWAAALAFVPAAWVAYELALARLSPHGTLWSLAYTATDCLPLVQLAAWFGEGAITFALLLAACALAAALERRWRTVAPAGALLAAAVIAGALRLAADPPPDRVHIALVALDRPYPDSPEQSAAALAEYAAILPGGVDVVVLPELIAEAPSADDPLFARLRAAAAARRVSVVAGAALAGDAALLIEPDGRVAATYRKQHLIPGLEDRFQRGHELVARGAWGIAICKDMDFATPARDYAARGTGLVLVPAWDRDADGWLHARMAVMRGVEYGFTIARSAKQGRLTVSDDRGRVLAEATSGVRPALLDVVAPVGHRTTLYQRIGDAFAWLCVALAALALAALAGARKLKRVQRG
jgi:apolipoprotein N-acyltransferase